jgi:apolipoprotein N-acyltransferase
MSIDNFIDFFLCLLFIFLHFLCKKNGTSTFLLGVLIYSCCFILFLFGPEFIYFLDDATLLVCFFTLTYNIAYFSSYRIGIANNVVSAIIHSLFFTLIACYAKIVPLNPLILLYYKFNGFFYTIPYPVINLFLLYLSVSVLPFLNIKLTPIYFLACCFMFLIQQSCLSTQGTHQRKIKIGVVQVGLYYQLGGNTTDFLSDLLRFLKENDDIDIVAFSENTVYGFKSQFGEKITKKLISDLKISNAHQHHAFIFNFFGFDDINNVVSAYYYKDDFLVNQKKTLIPFVEQKWPFSDEGDSTSEYLSIHKDIINKNIIYNGMNIKTHICYDVLFPEIDKSDNELVIVQSNYKRLDKNDMYNRIIKNGSILGWFAVAINSSAYINIQNHGGTVLIRKNGKIDDDVFAISLKEPFFVIDI